VVTVEAPALSRTAAGRADLAKQAYQSGEFIIHSQMHTAPRMQRASDFLENLVRRVYYAVAILCAVAPIVLPFLRVEQTNLTSAWLFLSPVIVAGAYVLLLHLRSSEDEG
jgi:hypothetical protein